MSPIKLFLLGTLEDGTKRLQSQLPYIYNHKSADFIIQDGKLYKWDCDCGKFTWVETNIPYVIITDGKEMLKQKL